MKNKFHVIILIERFILNMDYWREYWW